MLILQWRGQLSLHAEGSELPLGNTLQMLIWNHIETSKLSAKHHHLMKACEIKTEADLGSLRRAFLQNGYIRCQRCFKVRSQNTCVRLEMHILTHLYYITKNNAQIQIYYCLDIPQNTMWSALLRITFNVRFLFLSLL